MVWMVVVEFGVSDIFEVFIVMELVDVVDGKVIFWCVEDEY